MLGNLMRFFSSTLHNVYDGDSSKVIRCFFWGGFCCCFSPCFSCSHSVGGSWEFLVIFTIPKSLFRKAHATPRPLLLQYLPPECSRRCWRGRQCDRTWSGSGSAQPQLMKPRWHPMPILGYWHHIGRQSARIACSRHDTVGRFGDELGQRLANAWGAAGD